jgi:hypothetical protein
MNRTLVASSGVFLVHYGSELPTLRYKARAVEECTVEENKEQIHVMKAMISKEGYL